MRRTTWYVLLALTLVAVAGAVVVLQQRAARFAVQEIDESLFPGLEGRVNDVAELSVVTLQDRWTLRRKGDGAKTILWRSGLTKG